MDNIRFIYLKKWAEDVAWEIMHIQEDGYPCNIKKIQSVILESMSSSKMWKNGK